MNKRLLLMVLLALAALLLAACGEPALQADVSHEGEAAVTHEEGSAEGETAPAETPTDEATAEATPAETPPADDHAQEMEGMAATPAEATPIPGDPAPGQELFTTLRTEVGFACATCHRVDSTAQLIGPGLLNVSVHGAMHVEGLDAYAYIYQSITEPGAFVVPGFPDNLMPRTYSDLFSAQDIQDIIAYLFTLTG